MFYIKRLFLLTMLVGFGYTLHAQSTDQFDLDEVYDIDPDGKISLNSDDAEVTVTGTDRSDVHVEVHYRLEVTGFTLGSRTRFDMEVHEENGNLVIEEQPRDFSGINFGSTDEEYTIRIEAPRGVNLDMDGDDETYEVREINGAININADDSEASLYSCSGSDFSFSMDDGSIIMDEGRGSLRVDVDDGEADIRNGNFSSIELDSDDGDFNISSAFTNGGPYRFDMDDGDLTLTVLSGGGTFRIWHDNADISIDSAFREIIDEENEAEFKLEGGSAGVSIDVDDADIELRKSE